MILKRFDDESFDINRENHAKILRIKCYIKKVAYARAYYLNEIEMYQQIITEGS